MKMRVLLTCLLPALLFFSCKAERSAPNLVGASIAGGQSTDTTATANDTTETTGTTDTGSTDTSATSTTGTTGTSTDTTGTSTYPDDHDEDPQGTTTHPSTPTPHT